MNVFVYPTICKSSVTISGVEGADVIKVVSLTGQVVQTISNITNDVVLDVSSLSQGTYTLVIVKGLMVTKAQIIKK